VPNFDVRGATRCGSTTVAVAQLVESRIVIPVVVGSNPISHPISLSARTARSSRRGLAIAVNIMVAQRLSA
jgi:hypothetical protein